MSRRVLALERGKNSGETVIVFQKKQLSMDDLHVTIAYTWIQCTFLYMPAEHLLVRVAVGLLDS